MRPAIYAHQSGSGDSRVEPELPVHSDSADLVGFAEPSGYMIPGSNDEGGSSSPASTTNTQPASGTPATAAKPKRAEGGRNAKSQGLRQITADRPIFTLSVAADLLGLHPRTLRIYEEKKLVVPARTDGNRRRYSQLDIEKFQAIRLLTKGGVNLEGVRIILEMAEELTLRGGNPTTIIERNLEAED